MRRKQGFIRSHRQGGGTVRLSRRDLLKAGAMAAAAVAVPAVWIPRKAFAFIPGGSLDPATIPKYVDRLFIPPAMPETVPGFYEIAARQFTQQILPSSLPPTTIWGYGSANHPTTFHYPAYTVEADYGRPLRVNWINELVDGAGNFLPHLLPVDPTLHWANPPGGNAGRDSRPEFAATPSAYPGPVPIVTHLHGGHSEQESDGYPEAWFLPAANDIPAGFATTGTYYDIFRLSSSIGGWEPGTAVFEYRNDQRATTLWFHDHVLGMSRANVYSGLAGFYLIRGGPDDLRSGKLPGPAPGVDADPLGTFFEIPIVIQDRSFNTDGSLFYPDSRVFFDGFAGPYIPGSDVPPIWNPEFFGNTMVVNGNTWPALEVERRRYRFRFLNACGSRFLILKFDKRVSFWQIGSDGGFLPEPVKLRQLLMGPAERADVIVDFTKVPLGTEITLLNLGPDEPFGGGVPGVDFAASDPLTTGQVMKFVVVPRTGKDHSVEPEDLNLPRIRQIGDANRTRQLSLNEEVSTLFDGPIAAKLGTMEGGLPVPMMWDDAITENPSLGSTEIWSIQNFTEDAHPIHIHLVQFRVLNRQPMTGGGGPRPPEAWERGFKDTVIAYPGEITQVKANFDIAGQYVWHCHILEHEDNEMMRPYIVA